MHRSSATPTRSAPRRGRRSAKRPTPGALHVGGVWAGHAWNEVWIEGRWFALDATIGLGRADALRLAMSASALSGDEGAEAFAGVTANLGAIAIETVEIGADRPRRPAEHHGRVVDSRYVDRLFGVTFRLPPAVPLALRRPTPTLDFELVGTEPVPEAPVPPFRISLYVFDADHAGRVPSPLRLEDPVELVLDGRAASAEHDGRSRRILVVTRGVVFDFRFDDVDPADDPAVDAVLASVDFDV